MEECVPLAPIVAVSLFSWFINISSVFESGGVVVSISFGVFSVEAAEGVVPVVVVGAPVVVVEVVVSVVEVEVVPVVVVGAPAVVEGAPVVEVGAPVVVEGAPVVGAGVVVPVVVDVLSWVMGMGVVLVVIVFAPIARATPAKAEIIKTETRERGVVVFAMVNTP